MNDSNLPSKTQVPLALTISHILSGVFSGMKNQGITPVFDPNLQIRSSQEGRIIERDYSLGDIVKKNKEFKDNKNPSFPIFAWNRDPLGFDPNFNQKIMQLVESTGGGTGKIWAGAIGQVAVRWKYYTQTMPEMEQFEVFYLLNRAINEPVMVELSVFDEDPVTYTLEWGQLQNLEHNDDNIAYAGVSGDLTISGPILILINPEACLLEKIIFRVYVTVENSPIIEVPLSTLVDRSILDFNKEITIKRETS